MDKARLEQTIRIADQLYEFRRLARSTYGERYEKAVEPWRELIRDAMAKHGFESQFEAGMQLARDLKAYGQWQGMNPMWIGAAVIEEIEAESTRLKQGKCYRDEQV